MLTQTWAYMESQVADALNGLPTWLVDDIANFGLDIALDLTYQLTKDYTGSYFYEELQGGLRCRCPARVAVCSVDVCEPSAWWWWRAGLADGAGLDYMTLVRIHLIGELVRCWCALRTVLSMSWRVGGTVLPCAV